MYFMLYSFERYFVESLRTDSLMIGSFRQAQVISIVLFALGLIFYTYLRKNRQLNKGSAVGAEPDKDANPGEETCPGQDENN